MTGLALGAGLSSIGGGIAGLLHALTGESPSGEANKYLDQIPGTMKGYYDPFINRGTRANDVTENIYNTLSNNPQDFYKKIMGGYQESPGYQYNLKRSLGAIDNAAAAGGRLGTPMHQEEAARVASGLSSQDFNQFAQMIMQLLGQGLQGNENALQRGYGASTSFADSLANLLGAKGQYAAQEAGGMNKMVGDAMGNIFSGGASLLPMFFGGG